MLNTTPFEHLRQVRTQRITQFAQPAIFVLGHQSHCLVARRHGDGIPVIGTSMMYFLAGAMIEDRHDCCTAGDRTDRKAATNDLTHRHQVRCYAIGVTGTPVVNPK